MQLQGFLTSNSYSTFCEWSYSSFDQQTGDASFQDGIILSWYAKPPTLRVLAASLTADMPLE